MLNNFTIVNIYATNFVFVPGIMNHTLVPRDVFWSCALRKRDIRQLYMSFVGLLSL